EGYLNVPGSATINWNQLTPAVKSCMSEKLNRLYDIHLVATEEPGFIQFLHNEDLAEGHYSFLSSDVIRIEYSTDASAFHAVMSLLQMITLDSGKARIPKVRIEDEPRFEWRGLHLDVARHFFTVDEVKRFIDLMALYKFNVFHWHLTDDQGWRIEIKKYPLLTSVGGYRDSTLIGHYSDKPRSFEVKKYGGFYTQEQVKEIVQYADDRYITVVPEIEMPGHARAALAAYPNLSCTGVKQPVEGLWGIFDDIYCSKEESILFLQEILGEVLDLFPSKFIHIGGDEAPKSRWNECPACQANMQKHGLHDAHELQSYFVGRMDDYLTQHGRQLIGWDEILEGGLSPNAAVMSWRGEQGGIDAAKQGHQVVMTPTGTCYFDYYQSSHSQETLAIGGFLPLEKVYAFEPVPPALSAEEAKFILGGQANLWTEYISSMEHVEYMMYPRALALAQSLWCKKKPTYADFLSTFLEHQERYLRASGIRYAQSIHYPELHSERADGGINIWFSSASEKAAFHVNSTISSGKEVRKEMRMMTRDDRLFIPRSADGQMGSYSIEVSTTALRDTFDFKLGQSTSLGLKIEMHPLPHAKYNHNGSLNLVDGVVGKLPWKGSEWLGFNVPKFELIVDLESRIHLKGLSIGLLDSQGSWIYLPETLSVEGSDDGVHWKEIKRIELASFTLRDGRLILPFQVETRFLKVGIKTMDLIPEGKDGAGNVPWTFIDELEILR
ncbi:MAG: hypothetical protein A3D92_02740, partial [Bacteroidetes bacterium RIFCSPHIGHO2_02_FULL_44_7]